MRPVTKAVTGIGTTEWIKLDHKTNPFNVGFGCVVSGTATYTVQHTFDSVDSGTPTPFNNAYVAGQTANADGNYAFPVCAIRVNLTAGTGTVTITAIQAGDGG